MNLLLRIAYQPYKWLIVLPLAVSATLIGALVCILAVFIFDEDTADAVALNWGRFCCWIVPIRLEVIGRENYIPGRSYVMVSNHQSMADIPALYAALDIRIKWIMKQELKRVPIFGLACDKLGCIYIDRSNRNRAIQAMETARKKLSNRASVMFFAEGTRSRDGRVKPFKKGAFRFAKDCGLPVLPITIKDSIKILPSDSLNLLPGTITIIVHPPLDLSQCPDESLDQIIRDTRDTVAHPLTV
ncbi:MAG: 1-acyl-sn-glycerol-3-phosphate acyltransferase [Desulfobacteraceae bacterium]|nr:MAG: 1-acyl-sn-glycerol-3-phosphate acyltransferase [Desulfobacteraceae bacterium]